MVEAVYMEHFVRVVVTFVLFVVLRWPTNPYALVLAILVLDAIGSLHTLFFGKGGDIKEKERVNKTEEYQQADKISDALTYLMLLYLLPNDPVLYFFIVYRVVGVCLYVWTQQVWPVIVFFDFVKEYIIYKHLFGKSEHANAILSVSILFKILFEIYFHTIHNKHVFVRNVNRSDPQPIYP